MTEKMAAYEKEVLGKHVVLPSSDDAKPFRVGQVREVNIALKEDGNLEIKHGVWFDGEDLEWFDLWEEDQMNRLTWVKTNEKRKQTRRISESGALPETAKRARRDSSGNDDDTALNSEETDSASVDRDDSREAPTPLNVLSASEEVVKPEMPEDSTVDETTTTAQLMEGAVVAAQPGNGKLERTEDTFLLEKVPLPDYNDSWDPLLQTVTKDGNESVQLPMDSRKRITKAGSAENKMALLCQLVIEIAHLPKDPTLTTLERALERGKRMLVARGTKKSEYAYYVTTIHPFFKCFYGCCKGDKGAFLARQNGKFSPSNFSTTNHCPDCIRKKATTKLPAASKGTNLEDYYMTV